MATPPSFLTGLFTFVRKSAMRFERNLFLSYLVFSSVEMCINFSLFRAPNMITILFFRCPGRLFTLEM